jgi:hypothetical protein
MASSARRRAPVAATVAAAPLHVATACVGPGAVLCASAGYWATLLRIYPGGAGATAIVWLLLAAATLFGVTTVAVATAFAAGAGAWADRLRAAPLAALLALCAAAGGLLLAVWAVTGDPAVQEPASAVVAGAALLAAALFGLRTPALATWDLRRLGPVELQMSVAMGMASTLAFELLAQPWETAKLAGAANLPAWQFTTVVLTVSVFTGQFLLQTLQRPGAGTLALMVAFAVRALLIGVLQRPMGGFAGAAPAYLLALAPAGIMDLIYFYNLGRGGDTRLFWQALTTAVTATLVGGLLVLENLAAYPPVTSATIPGIVAAGALAGFGAGWLGMVTGRWLAGQRRFVASVGARWLDFVGLGMTAAALAAVVAWAARMA